MNSANAFKKIVPESVQKLTKKLNLKNQEFFYLYCIYISYDQ